MLRYVITTLTACGLAGVISVSAQEQPPPQTQKEQEKPATEAATLTGCVQEAKTTDGGTAYILNKAEGGTAPLYVLVGPPPSEFASHVNKKVEVTGQVQQPPPAAEEAPKDPKVLRPPLVQVESVKSVADSCQ
jgi:predicted small lipoprotein YifL